ncbi:MAG: hypothetical protein WBN04_21755 [Paracoccaceae bacterium]
MQFVRPELKEAIWRCREALIGVFVSILGMYWAIAGDGILQIIGTSLTIAGALLFFAGIQRARFRTGSGGAGVVHVMEGQVAYYGPYEGGAMAVAELTKVELDPTTKPVSQWILHDPHSPPLRIPTNAEGAEALFDVFAGLEGIQTERMLTELTGTPDRQVVIWQAAAPALH